MVHCASDMVHADLHVRCLLLRASTPDQIHTNLRMLIEYASCFVLCQCLVLVTVALCVFDLSLFEYSWACCLRGVYLERLKKFFRHWVP